MPILSFLLSLLFHLSSPNDTTAIKPSKDTESTPVNKTLLLQLVNDVRKKGCQCGDTYYSPAPAVGWSSQLEGAALVHSNDMYANNYFSHAAKDGSKASDRIDATGYHWRTYGENIAFGYRNEKEVIEGWVKSPGHCKNIMNKTYKEMGVSRVGDYWTQVFAAK